MRLFIAAAALAAFAVPAAASFDGATIDLQYYFPDLGSPFSTFEQFVVGAGVESTFFPDDDPRTNLDFGGTNLYITYNSASNWTFADFNGFVFADTTNTLDTIVGVSVNAATNMVGFDASRVSFTGDTVAVNWNGLSFNEQTIVSLDFRFGDAAIPEPATWAMMILGFGLVGAAARRRTAIVAA
jgi:hypothetical protein